MAQPLGSLPHPARDAWMTTIGMFDGDALMKEIDQLGAEWRREETERELVEWDREHQ